MAVQHTNARRQVYYLHQGVGKTGGPNYYFSLTDDGDLATAIPPGFETYENPNGQVFLRRVRKQLITDDEAALVQKRLQRFRHLRSCRVDVKGHAISVYTPDQDVEALADLWPDADPQEFKASLARCLTFSAEMRFVLADNVKRLFIVQRYCYSGSIDDWIDVDGPDELPKLVKYLRHLGKDSFYEMGMP